ncbi:MAG: WYL domain-containing transcriptional regulator [Lachnospiraceae bacterium]|nr:WYL domain-containing transcriptional regulator [Lachnospiraceae bacterium]
MSRKANQKIKLLTIVDILRNETDESHPLTTNELCKKLANKNIPCNRKVLYNDVKTLNDCGYEVMTLPVGREKGYYMDDTTFSLPELKIMVDAVQAASFITEKKSEELTGKIAALGGSQKAALLTQNIVHFNTTKHTNESIYYIVGTLEEAIRNHMKASFYYFDLNENGERVYRKDKERYITDPLSLIYNDDNYYMICYTEKHANYTSYRLDRMEQVNIENEEISEISEQAKAGVTKYVEESFNMFSGQIANVILKFDDSLIGVIYDKFGEDIKMLRSDDSSCVVTATIRVSPTFWGWLFQFADKMQILSPAYLIELYKEKCQKIIAAINRDEKEQTPPAATD